ncbi:MAG: discoidin domain-containing protein, partial [Anaerolineae bacterium]
MVHAQDATRAAPHPIAGPSATPRADDARYANLPYYIFGLHDSGGEAQMFAAGKPGWIVVSVQVNPPDSTGDFSALANQGLGVIVRLNNGYGRAGTLPHSTGYEEFARQCAEFVAHSRGARLWVIGNEPNAAQSRPGDESASHSGEVITPEMYARCFNQCRQAIRSLHGHEHDWVIPAAVATFNSQTTYPTNPSGDWVRYFADVLVQITMQGGKADALALHTFTHGAASSLIPSDAQGTGKFSNRHWHFRAYRDFLAAVTPTMRHLPVLITAAAPLDPGWTSRDKDWIQAAFAEINDWNANPTNQAIQALCLFRWHAFPDEPSGWGMSDKPSVVDDLCAALQNDYRVRWPSLPPIPDYRVQWITPFSVPEHTMAARGTVTGRIVLKNTGAKIWETQGAHPVHLGCRWYRLDGGELPSDLLAALPFIDLPHPVLPGQTIELDSIAVVAPKLGGPCILRFDLKPDEGEWFSALGAPVVDLHLAVVAPPLAGEWVRTPAPAGDRLLRASSTVESVAARNLGAGNWASRGAQAVRLVYQWLDQENRSVTLLGSSTSFDLTADVAPGQVATFEPVTLTTPPDEGAYTLRWSLLAGDTDLSEQGIEAFSQLVHVFIPIPDWSVEWAGDFNIPAQVEPNDTLCGSLTVKNTGARIWSVTGEDRVHLEYRWYDAQDRVIEGALYRGVLSLPVDVVPNDAATFADVALRAPVARSGYRLVFDLVQAGTNRFADAGNRPLEFRVVVQTDAPDYVGEWLHTLDIPKRALITGEVVRGRVALKNTGALSWDVAGDHRMALGYCWFDRKGQTKLVNPIESPALTEPVLPQETATWAEVELRVPETPDKYVLEWKLQRGPGDTPTIASMMLSVQVKAPPLEWGGAFLGHDIPPSLVTGQTATVTLHLENTGKNTWPSEGEHPVVLIGKWLDQDGNALEAAGARVPLASSVSPEAALELSAEVMAPPLPGMYRLHWDLYPQGLDGFAVGGNAPLVVPIKVTETPAPHNLWRAQASHNAAAAYLAIDGDLSTFWSSQEFQAQGMWFRLNLDASRIIDGIALRSAGQGYPRSYVVRISADGATWRTIAQVPQGNTGDLAVTFAPCEVLCVQVELQVSASEEWHIAQVQIHTSPGWSATASTNNDEAMRALDNDPDTAWSTGEMEQKPNIWFQLDLGRVEQLNGLVLISPDNEIPAGYRITVWNQQAGGWQKVAERLDNRDPVTLAWAPVQTQYINIQLLQPA